jgi:hypothetical protein
MPSDPTHAENRATQFSTLRTRFSFTVRALLMAIFWTGCVGAAIRSDHVINRANELRYMYVLPLAWTALLVSLQLVAFRQSHQWFLGRCIWRGGIVGVLCFALLWGPLIFHLRFFIPDLPYPPLVPGRFLRRFLGCAGIIIYGVTTGAFVSSVWSLAVRSMHNCGLEPDPPREDPSTH